MTSMAKFTSYATSTAFRIDLTKHMVRALMDGANGKDLDTGHYGVKGLLDRGLVELRSDGQQRSWAKRVQITDAGAAVARLCEMAGLGEIAPASELEAAA